MSVVDQQLVTVEQYARLPESGRPTELVRGRIVEMNVPTPRHGQICNEIGRLLGNYVKEKGLGKVTSNDSGIITERDPDTMRGADVAFYSNKRFGEGPLPGGYFEEAPELVFEVLSSNDRWSKILSNVAEYLDAGVAIVCVLDPGDRTAYVYEGDRPVRILTADQEIEFPELLGEFRVRVAGFFE